MAMALKSLSFTDVRAPTQGARSHRDFLNEIWDAHGRPLKLMSPTRLLPLLLLAVLSPASGLTLVLNRRAAVRALAAAPLLGSAPVLADDLRLNSAGFAEIKRLKDAQKQLNTAVREEKVARLSAIAGRERNNYPPEKQAEFDAKAKEWAATLEAAYAEKDAALAALREGKEAGRF